MSDWELKPEMTLDDFLDGHIEYEGKKQLCFDQERALAFLLMENVCFLNTRCYVRNDWQEKEKWRLSENPTTVVYVNCNDVFAWATGDADDLYSDDLVPIEGGDEDVRRNELYDLLSLHLEDRMWGSVKWVAIKRNIAPQSPMVHDMIEAGVWDERMQALEPNEMDLNCCDWHRSLQTENQKAAKGDDS